MAGLYIHIPFCKKKCLYCDFVSRADCSAELQERYTGALLRELDALGKRFSDKTVSTVFIGGGTPSVMPSGAIARILAAAKNAFHILPDAEITAESNPNTLSEGKLEEFLTAGINRLSLGVQSANDLLLKRIGRIHSFQEAEETYKAARRAGFSNINIDIMYGLPGQDFEDHLKTIDIIAGLAPEHISAYSLILEENTPLYDMVERGNIALPDEDEEFDMHARGITQLIGHGYERYEVSNYAKPGFYCRHNLNYWANGEYIGAGVAAHSAYRENGLWTRHSNTSSVDEYIQKAEESASPIEDTQVISKAEEMFETIMVGLRKTHGISDAEFSAQFGVSVLNAYPNAIAKLQKQGHITTKDGNIRMTESGLDMLNAALVLFMEEQG